MYTAAVLDHQDQQILRQKLNEFVNLESLGYLFETQNGSPLPHHMTINMGRFNQELNNITLLGKKVCLKVDAFLYNHDLNVCCARVCEALYSDIEILTVNDYKHITMAIRFPGKPFHSNKLFISKSTTIHEFEKPMELNGKIEECK